MFGRCALRFANVRALRYGIRKCSGGYSSNVKTLRVWGRTGVAGYMGYGGREPGMGPGISYMRERIWGMGAGYVLPRMGGGYI